jgi:hypothetical protein
MAILQADGTLPDSVTAHIETCTECRNFAETVRVTMATGHGHAPSRELDKRVLTDAHTELARRAAARPRMLLMPILRWTAAAALLAVVFAVSMLLRDPAEEPSSATVAQNPQQPPAETMTWKTADLDLAVIEQEVDAALAQLRDIGEPRLPRAGASVPDTPAQAVGINGLDNALFELECDVYFELQEIASDG